MTSEEKGILPRESARGVVATEVVWCRFAGGV